MSVGSKSTLRKKARKGFRGYPVATVAFYGPDDKRASKVAVGIVANESGQISDLKRWYAEFSDLRQPGPIEKEVLEFIRFHQVRTVVVADRIIGCPHEEGIDYPEGESCPVCPFWKDRDRWTGDRPN